MLRGVRNSRIFRLSHRAGGSLRRNRQRRPCRLGGQPGCEPRVACQLETASESISWARSGNRTGGWGRGRPSGVGPWRIKPRDRRRRSVDDVQGVAERPIQLGSRTRVEVAHTIAIKGGLGHGDQVVAVDHRVIGQTVLGPHLHFRGDSADGPGYRCACQSVENGDRSVPCDDTYRPSARRRPEVGPDDVVSGYHSGAVSAASRCDASSSAASGGCFVYAAMRRSSARAHRSASRTATAPRRISSDLLSPTRRANSSSLATRSSSS